MQTFMSNMAGTSGGPAGAAGGPSPGADASAPNPPAGGGGFDAFINA